MSRVLIVNMPFSNLRWPNLGPSLLKAALQRRGIGCDLAYLSFDFAERIGLEDYLWIADSFAFVLGGERIFAKHYFGGRLPDDESYFRDVLLAADPGLSEEDRASYARIGEHVEPFLDAAMNSIDWSQYAIVGFAASFQQTMASMCLARGIKAIRPEIKVVLGGAACHGEMGIELLRQFPEIDYVFLGEADLTFLQVVEQILSGDRVRLPVGVIGREIGSDALPLVCSDLSSAPEPSAFMVRELDDLPYPDFDDYFARLRASPLAGQIDPLLFFETSRGCWWGEKHHCAFCGLNGASLEYRSKSPERAIEELRYLVERHSIRRACSADNILDYRYFKTFLPRLKASGLDLRVVYEMKANLTREQVRVLLDAGLRAAQLGIETFSTPILKRIGKGANALQNLQALKWFSEAGIAVEWNFLYGFPGESPEEYAALADLVPSLYHLAPPLAVGRVRLDRFSPYFRDPAAHGISNPRPNGAFRYVYPFPQESLARIACYFEFDYADGRNPLAYAAPALRAVEDWQQVHDAAALRYYDRPDGVLLLHDTRPGALEFQRRLTGLARRVYLFCDTGRSLRQILALAGENSEGIPVSEAAVRNMLDQWTADRLVVHVDGRYLSLALHTRQ